MAKKVNIHFEEFKKHTEVQEKYAKKVAAIFSGAAQDAAIIGASLTAPAGKAFSFKQYPRANKAIEKLVANMKSDIVATITEGTTEEWLHAAKLNDTIVKQVFHNSKLTNDQIKKYMNRNLDALYAFQTRKIGGLALSDRVWKYTNQFKEEIEMALDLGLGEGKSAAALSRDVKQYLQNPDKLFHRVRDKHGKLQLSKNAKAYHPGRGVYRSSHKNAMRLTRTEVNMAYRTSDFTRIQQLDFVIGIRVKLSNNHTLNGVPFTDICDNLAGVYPKEFKFTGWHPQCRCHSETILADEEEFLEYQQAILDGGDVSGWKFKGSVDSMPPQFIHWIDQHSDSIKNAKSLPYFLKENFPEGSIQGSVNLFKKAPQKAKQTIQESQKAMIEQASLAYEKEYAQKKIEQALAAGHTGPELDALKIALGNPSITASQLASKSNKLLHAVKGTTKKVNTIPAPPPNKASKEAIKKAVADHTPTDPLRAKFEKKYAKKEVDGLLDAYYKHTAKKSSKPPGEYLSYLDYEISWIKDNSLKKYATAPELLKLLQAERDKIQAIIAKEVKEAAKKTIAAQKEVLKNFTGVATDFKTHKAVTVRNASNDLKRLEKELAGELKPEPKTLQTHYTKAELKKLREMEKRHALSVIKAEGDDWRDSVIQAESEVNAFKKEMAIKYHAKKRKLPKLDNMTEKEYAEYIKNESKRLNLADVHISGFNDERIKKIAKDFGLAEEEVRAVLIYTSNTGYSINAALRKIEPLTDELRLYSILANRGIPNFPRFEGVVRRGTSLSPVLDKLKQAIKEGKTWRDDGFISAAFRGSGFSDKLKMRIKTKTGGILDEISTHPHEYEILLRSGREFKVLSLYERDGQWYAYLEEI